MCSTIKMKFVFVLLVAAIHCRLSIGLNTRRCRMAADRLREIDDQCTDICDDCTEDVLRERCNCHPFIEPCMTVKVTATHTVTYAPPVVTITPTCSPPVVAPTCSPPVVAPTCSLPVAKVAPSCPTTITQYSSISPTNCLQSTHTKEMSTTVGTSYTDTVTRNSSTVTDNLNTTTCTCSLVTVTAMSTTGGDSKSSLNTATEAVTSNSNQGTPCNSSPVTLGAFIAVLAALLVAVTTGWIITCVVNRRKDKASTTSNKDNNALQNPVYDSEHVQRYQGNLSARTQTGYSSQGPAYEQVRVDTGTDYDVIDRSGPRPPTTHPVPISDQDYSTLDTDEQEHDYHVLESTNAGGPTAVGGQEHDYHVLESTNAGGTTAVGGQEPQDYEIPLRKM